MKGSIAALASLALGMLSLTSGCTANCSASDQKLGQLQRGMSYDETARIMGCAGSVVSEATPASGDYASVEYNGPDSSLFMRTRLDFMHGTLLYYTTDSRFGF